MGPQGRGTLAGGGGQQRASSEPQRPAWRRRGRAGSPPPPGVLAQEKPGSPGGEEEVLRDPLPASADPAPGRSTWGAAGLCLGHHETPDASPLEVKPRSSRASAGRSGGEWRDPVSPSTHNFPAFHLGLAELRADLDAGLWAEGDPWPGLPVGAGGGDVPLAPSSSPRMAWSSE